MTQIAQHNAPTEPADWLEGIRTNASMQWVVDAMRTAPAQLGTLDGATPAKIEVMPVAASDAEAGLELAVEAL